MPRGEIGKLEHSVKLMPPRCVKAYVTRGKTDAGDAAAICEAVTRPSMALVRVKGGDQQGLLMLHHVGSQLIGQRTQLINALGGHLTGFGIVAAEVCSSWQRSSPIVAASTIGIYPDPLI